MSDPNSLTLLAAGALGVGYALHVALWPYRACPVCRGFGYQAHPLNRRALRPCRACAETGVTPRWAYRLYRNRRNRHR